jgi:hypothetical protein
VGGLPQVQTQLKEGKFRTVGEFVAAFERVCVEEVLQHHKPDSPTGVWDMAVELIDRLRDILKDSLAGRSTVAPCLSFPEVRPLHQTLRCRTQPLFFVRVSDVFGALRALWWTDCSRHQMLGASFEPCFVPMTYSPLCSSLRATFQRCCRDL